MASALFDSKAHTVIIGKSFINPDSSNVFHTGNYSSEPKFNGKKGTVEIKHDQVTMTIPRAEGQAQTFKGTKMGHTNKAVLVINKKTGKIVLERIGCNITLQEFKSIHASSHAQHAVPTNSEKALEKVRGPSTAFESDPKPSSQAQHAVPTHSEKALKRVRELSPTFESDTKPSSQAQYAVPTNSEKALEKVREPSTTFESDPKPSSQAQHAVPTQCEKALKRVRELSPTFESDTKPSSQAQHAVPTHSEKALKRVRELSPTFESDPKPIIQTQSRVSATSMLSEKAIKEARERAAKLESTKSTKSDSKYAKPNEDESMQATNNEIKVDKHAQSKTDISDVKSKKHNSKDKKSDRKHSESKKGKKSSKTNDDMSDMAAQIEDRLQESPSKGEEKKQLSSVKHQKSSKTEKHKSKKSKEKKEESNKTESKKNGKYSTSVNSKSMPLMSSDDIDNTDVASRIEARIRAVVRKNLAMQPADEEMFVATRVSTKTKVTTAPRKPGNIISLKNKNSVSRPIGDNNKTNSLDLPMLETDSTDLFKIPEHKQSISQSSMARKFESNVKPKTQTLGLAQSDAYKQNSSNPGFNTSIFDPPMFETDSIEYKRTDLGHQVTTTRTQTLGLPQLESGHPSNETFKKPFMNLVKDLELSESDSDSD